LNNKKLFIYDRSSEERLDRFLTEEMPDLSRSQIQRLIKVGNVTVNDQIITKNGFSLDKKGQTVTIKIPTPKPLDIVPEKRELDILFENKDLIVINKPAGIVMHPSAGHRSGTLVHAALGYDPFMEGIGGIMRPGIVHRLDKNTSGVVVLAKNDVAHGWLQKQFKDRLTQKFYIALVDKHPPTDTGKIDAPIYRDPTNRKKMAIAPKEKGKSAVSIYSTIRKFKKHGLLRVQILTGRTHQIRVHLASIGSPVSGDIIYGYSTSTIPINRHFLHASSLEICLPHEKKLSKFEAPLPKELEEVLENL